MTYFFVHLIVLFFILFFWGGGFLCTYICIHSFSIFSTKERMQRPWEIAESYILPPFGPGNIFVFVTTNMVIFNI